RLDSRGPLSPILDRELPYLCHTPGQWEGGRLMWKRRELLGVLGTGTAGLAITATRSQAGEGQAPVPEPKHSAHDPKHAQMLKECEEACAHCESTCNTTFHHCVMLAGQG